MEPVEKRKQPPSSRRWEELRELELDERLVAALRRQGFDNATPVQAVGIPPLLRRLDVAVDAETGSGKTLAFLVPAMQMLMTSKERSPLGVLVIEPTRELATQVYQVATGLSEAVQNEGGREMKVELLTGGGRSGVEVPTITTDILIATAGRLVAALSSGAVDPRGLHLLILDEADRLLDCGFETELAIILARMPKQRRTGLYSATQTEKIRELARAGLRNPVRVAVERIAPASQTAEDGKVPASLESYYVIREQDSKLGHLIEFLATRHNEKIIVFFLTCHSVEFHAKLPWKELFALSHSNESTHCSKLNLWSMHGKMGQNRRTRALTEFEASERGVLFCTDVAARGIDIPDIDWIVQLDPPQDPDAYVHRVGRTARLGRGGKALLYLTSAEEEYVDFLSIRKCGACVMPATVADVSMDSVCNVVRNAIMNDRDVMEQGEKGFLSFLRGYKEHRCCYILQFDKLDFASVARSFHLLRMPRIAEFKKYRGKIAEFQPDRSVDLKSIKFQSRELERQRQVKLAALTANPRPRRQRDGKQKKSKRKQPSLSSQAPVASNNDLDDDELAELAEDARALKRRNRRGRKGVCMSSDEGEASDE